MKIPNCFGADADEFVSLARIVSEDSQLPNLVLCRFGKYSKDS